VSKKLILGVERGEASQRRRRYAQGYSILLRCREPYARPRESSVSIPLEETPSQISRANRYARYEAVRTLHQQLVSQRQIARLLKLSRNTVHTFLQAESFPERSPRP